MATRKEILEMLSEGKIDVTEATELLSAVNDLPEPPPVPAVPPPLPPEHVARRPKTRWLHIHVTDLETGKHRVKVNVPLSLVDIGMKLGARFTDEVDSDVMRTVTEAIHAGEVDGTLVEVEDLEDNERVHIFVD